MVRYAILVVVQIEEEGLMHLERSHWSVIVNVRVLCGVANYRKTWLRDRGCVWLMIRVNQLMVGAKKQKASADQVPRCWHG